jgi:succinate-semialdehyde dehydrogenase/glutarate-semialdehyde dehydrogenase
MGKPIREARAEVEKCAWLAEVYARNGAAWLAEEEVRADGREHRIVFEPLGVILSVMPWNFPFWQALRFGVPAVLAGNTSLLKHARNVPQSALAIEAAFRDAGFPSGVFRAVFADHETVGALIASEIVQGVSLTGSTEAGARIAETAGRALKKVVLELGGSDPFLVLEDADLDLAVRHAVAGRMVNAGQSCIAAKRFIVAAPIAEAFTERFAAAMRGLVVGDPLDERTQVGPLVDRGAVEQLGRQLEESVRLGAVVVAGGGPLDRPGFFFAPTVVTRITREMPVAREEVFGPIAPVIVALDDEDAIAIANDTPFGLGASVWTRNLARGARIARRLAAGATFVNSIVKSDPRMPFGGIKLSGIGRELSQYGLREFVNVKGISIYEHGAAAGKKKPVKKLAKAPAKKPAKKPLMKPAKKLAKKPMKKRARRSR